MHHSHSNVDLPAIIAGTAVALAISIILLHFGQIIGFTLTPEEAWDPETVAGQVITICLWGLWVQLLSSLVGGYITGRVRAPVEGASAHEREMRDGIHGLSVWAFGTVSIAIGAAVVAALAATSPEAQEQAELAAEVLQRNETVAVIAAFSTASVSLVSAVASWWAATKGGEHRDDGVDMSRQFSFRKK
jgi:hypothetical protein